MVPTLIVPLWSHFSDKLRHLSPANQYACPTPILIYPRVLHPGISRISSYCTTSYEFSDEVILLPVLLTPRLLGCRQPRPPNNESIPLGDSIPLVLVAGKFTTSSHHPYLDRLYHYRANFDCATAPSSRSTIFDEGLSLCRSPSSYHFALYHKLDFGLVTYP
jgi:hypothetical protein